MSDPSNGTGNGMTGLLDPFGIWRTTRDANMDVWKTFRDSQLELWAKVMVDFVNSDEYSRMSGQGLEQVLAASQPLREFIDQYMTTALALYNMPSRDEVTTIAERLVNVEMRLDDIDAKLNDLHKATLESVKETVQSSMATPNRHLRNIETQLEALDTRLNGFQKAITKLEPKPEPKPEPKAEAKPAAKKEQEAK